MRVGVFAQESATTLSGTVTVNAPGNNVSFGYIERWECLTTENYDIGITGGADSTTGTAFSVVTASVATDFLKTGDGISVAAVFPDDPNPTWGTPTLTAQGGGTISLGTVTQRAAPTSTSGQDIGGRIASALPTVSSQQLTGTLTYAATLSGTTTHTAGPLALVRIRAAVPTVSPVRRVGKFVVPQ